MSFTQFLRFILPVSLLTSACLAEEPESTEDETEIDSQVAASHRWIRAGGCALSIGVSPDNTIWVVGCDSATSGTIWSMRLETLPGELVSEEVWTPRQGTGQSVTVDNGGLAHLITTAGLPMIAVVPDTAANVVAEPTGAFRNEPQNSPCLRDFDMYHLDNLLVSHTSNRPVAFRDHHLFAVRCPTDRGNGIVLTRFGEETQWTATTELATQIALFNPGAAATRAQTLWTLNSDGVLKRFNESTRRFTTATAPPSFTYGLAEHFALTEGGVYQYNDSSDSWTLVVENTTPTGRVKEIAHAGNVPVTVPGGARGAVGPSELWGVDDTGAIYRAVRIVVPR